MDAVDFGLYVRVCRAETGMTMRELAEQADISPTYVSLIEGGKCPPPTEEVLVRLARALGINEDQLVNLSGRIPADVIVSMQRPPMKWIIRKYAEYTDEELWDIVRGL